jgi:rod shape determining protein RodA
MQKRPSFAIITTVAVLTLIGLIMIFSTADVSILIRQAIWLAIGIAFMFVFSRISPRVWSNLAPFAYITVVLLLILVLFNHDLYPRRWFRIGTMSLQPSEFAKLASILFLASYLSARKKLTRFSDILIPLAIVTLPAFLIIMEPDLGASQIFYFILIVMLYWAGMPAVTIFVFFSPLISAAASFSIYVWVAYFAALAVFLYFRRSLSVLIYGLVGNFLAGLIMPLVWNSLRVYQQQRIVSFFSPWVDPRGMSWQIIQSKIAIGSGRIIGKGFLSGTQKKLEFLPERHTDFIFSCLGEEFGLIGIVLVMMVFVFLLYRLLILAKETKNKFSSLIIIGVFAWLGYQTFLNIGMTMGLLPITGVPLPLVSYGGSSLLACYMAIGICLAILRTKFNY